MFINQGFGGYGFGRPYLAAGWGYPYFGGYGMPFFGGCYGGGYPYVI